MPKKVDSDCIPFHNVGDLLAAKVIEYDTVISLVNYAEPLLDRESLRKCLEYVVGIDENWFQFKLGLDICSDECSVR